MTIEAISAQVSPHSSPACPPLDTGWTQMAAKFSLNISQTRRRTKLQTLVENMGKLEALPDQSKLSLFSVAGLGILLVRVGQPYSIFFPNQSYFTK